MIIQIYSISFKDAGKIRSPKIEAHMLKILIVPDSLHFLFQSG